jgi:hypothetical protein
MNKFIVTTTINPPTDALIKYSKLNGWKVIVAGDLKTQHHLFSNLENIIYLTPDYQEKSHPILSELIGWKCIQRRNFAILEAYKLGADVIGIIDDDNVPSDTWGSELLVNKSVEVNYYDIDDVAFDSLGSLTGYNHLWHRGFPLERLSYRDYSKKTKKEIVPKVQAIYWNGDPDVDAICRMIYNPKCKFNDSEFPISSNRPSPFNSQNTIISRDIVKDYFLFPYVGRMDDIWASYYVQSKGHKVVFSKPEVISDRNMGTTGRYSNIEDMKREYLGMENNLNLLNSLSKNPDNIKDFLSERSWLAFNAWQKTIDVLSTTPTLKG